ncbi:hypothetical protein [Hymenobacter glacieicola]|uniref:Uncharacterized protein n=1 Tax=Hymenobacter glacieicola TaxID=1562124 RepID=A0ABQ1X8H8_9BACT|nr:hypothetical protein [Hymenobacter glacieicola]GGG61430.1 hypothetical protein GCM10011378_41840 [Hymenobacter glacieicola]
MMDFFKCLLIVALFAIRVLPHFAATWKDTEGFKIVLYLSLAFLIISIL